MYTFGCYIYFNDIRGLLFIDILTNQSGNCDFHTWISIYLQTRPGKKIDKNSSGLFYNCDE